MNKYRCLQNGLQNEESKGSTELKYYFTILEAVQMDAMHLIDNCHTNILYKHCEGKGKVSISLLLIGKKM